MQKFRKWNFWCNYFDSHKSIKHRSTKVGEKFGNVDKENPEISGLVTTTVLTNTKIK